MTEFTPARGVLVVDDNRDYAELLRRFLESRGYDVRVAARASEAVAAFDALRPGVVLLDYLLPGQDGVALCKSLRAHAEHGSRVRIVLLTGLTGAGGAPDALCADERLNKPVDLPTLLECVERNMEEAARER